MIRVKWLGLAIATSLLLSGCIPKRQPLFTCAPPSQSNQSPQSDTIDIAIYVDGSGSMLGYVDNATSLYAQTLEQLYNTFSLSKARPNSTVEYYRIGSNKKITESDFRKADLSEFYNGKNPNFPPVASPLDSAVIPFEGDKLLVMVTDLYQNEGDVTRLNKKIKEAYLNQQKKGYAVGILAVKSEFNGTVYVDGTSNNKFTYNTTGKKPDLFRPFYVMFLGPYKDINYYFDKLKSDGGQLFEDSQFVIFSPDNLVSDISYIGETQIEELPKGIKQTNSINDGNVALEEESSEKTELLEIAKNPEQDLLPIPYTVNFNLLSYTLPIDPNSIKSSINIEAFDRIEKKFISKTEDSKLQKALELSGWEMPDKNKLSFKTNINADAFEEPGVHKFTVDAVAQGLQEQSWWSEWNYASSDKPDDGSKTHNLVNFLRGVKTITTELMVNNQPVIGKFCYAIQKE